MESISLSELTTQIQETIRRTFTRPLWLRVEISDCRENNGHCYLELVEKEQDTDFILAKSRATIWASTYRMLKPYFESSTGQSLRAGINILVMVVVDFSGQYGFNLIIRDIDPTFTIGKMAARRMEVIRKLETDGVMDMNKQLPLAPLTQRIAVISSATAAGYDDFINQLNAYSFAFYTKLFPAVMQGAEVEKSIINALEKVYRHMDYFDAVLIIRGGGAVTDLSCFDSYNLALNCAQFPLPVIVGIGHTRDVSVLDMVAHTSVKTPTAAAEFLVNLSADQQSNLSALAEEIESSVSDRIQRELQKQEMIRYKLKQAAKTDILKQKYKLEKYKIELRNLLHLLLNTQKSRLQFIENKITIHSPAYLVKHGYTITLINGKRVSSVTKIKKGDKLKTYAPDGVIWSQCEKVEINQ